MPCLSLHLLTVSQSRGRSSLRDDSVRSSSIQLLPANSSKAEELQLKVMSRSKRHRDTEQDMAISDEGEWTSGMGRTGKKVLWGKKKHLKPADRN